jgi:hypothetical protein
MFNLSVEYRPIVVVVPGFKGSKVLGSEFWVLGSKVINR